MDRYFEVLVEVRSWEGVCYWCGKRFFLRKNQNDQPIGWREHINIEQETKIFCSDQCWKLWIDHKQVFGELMP